MTVDLEAHARLAELRVRVLNGETPPAHEMRELILDLQRGRDTAAAQAASSKARARKQQPKAAAAPIDLKKLFSSGDI